MLYLFTHEQDATGKIISLIQLYALLPEHERLIVDVLRGIVKENLPASFKKKCHSMFRTFYGKKGICVIWPSTIPRGGIKKGVCLDLCTGIG